MRSPSRLPRTACLVLSLALAACSGGGAPVAQGSAALDARCAVPRSGIAPWNGRAYPDVQGTLADEKAWLRSWIDELYLWYREVPSPDPAAFPTAVDYFDVLKTSAVTESGRPKDQFHFVYPTDLWMALSQSGVQAGYGVQWVLIERSPPRLVLAAFVEPGSPAALAGIARGDEVVGVDGVDVVSSEDVDALNAGLFPDAAGAQHVLRISGTLGVRDVPLTSADVELDPVPEWSTIDTPTGRVGYLLFNDHVATAEARLASVVTSLRDAGVSDLVLDLRYNGGGYLAIASELAYMIAGPAVTAGRTFERLVFNEKVTTTNPVTGAPLAPVPFYPTAQGFTVAPGTPLPTLGLGRVFVLTGSGTCSASEAVVNGLRGVGVEVLQIGATTCGKPYGFYPADNCGTTYFAIQFQGVNDRGFGSYGDGFVPGGTGVAGVGGCAIADDYGHALGDAGEARLSAALALRRTGSCPAPGAAALALPDPRAREGLVVKGPWRQNRIMSP